MIQRDNLLKEKVEMFLQISLSHPESNFHPERRGNPLFHSEIRRICKKRNYAANRKLQN